MRKIKDHFDIFHARTENVLNAYGIDTIEKLIELTPNEILKFRNSGKKTLEDIQCQLASMGLKLKEDEIDIDELSEIEALAKQIQIIKDSLSDTLYTLSKLRYKIRKKVLKNMI